MLTDREAYNAGFICIFFLQSKTVRQEVYEHHLFGGSSPPRQGWLQTTVAHAGVSCPLHGYFDIHIKDRLGKASYLSVQ